MKENEILKSLEDLNSLFDKIKINRAVELFNRIDNSNFENYFQLDLDEVKIEIKEELFYDFEERLDHILTEIDNLSEAKNQNTVIGESKRNYITGYLDDIKSEIMLDLMDINIELISNRLQEVLKFKTLGIQHKSIDELHREKWLLIEPYLDDRYNILVDVITKEKVSKKDLAKKVELSVDKINSTINWAKKKLKENV